MTSGLEVSKPYSCSMYDFHFFIASRNIVDNDMYYSQILSSAHRAYVKVFTRNFCKQLNACLFACQTISNVLLKCSLTFKGTTLYRLYTVPYLQFLWCQNSCSFFECFIFVIVIPLHHMLWLFIIVFIIIKSSSFFIGALFSCLIFRVVFFAEQKFGYSDQYLLSGLDSMVEFIL